MINIKKEKVLIRPEDIRPSSKDFEVLGVINPAASRLKDGRIILYVRVIERLKKFKDEKYYYSPRMTGKKKFRIKIDRFNKKFVKDSSDMAFIFEDGTKRLTFISHFRRVVLDEGGFKIISIDKKPSFYGLYNDGELGVEDPRITKIGEKYVMTYVTLSLNENISTSIAFSDDCKNWERKGIIFGEQDKDVVIFPEKINGDYVAFDRPEGNFQFSPPHIWIAYSKDLISWGKLRSVTIDKRTDETYGRNGAGPPPIKTKKGWLLIYHTAIKKTMKLAKEEGLLSLAKKIFKIKKIDLDKIHFYSVGAALFDLENPRKMISKSKSLILIPDKDYHKGSFENKRVVFPTGLVMDKNQKDILLYSGGGDIVTIAKKVSLKDIMKSLRKIK